MSSKVYKIAVVGDGPIGNLVIAKLLIEHFNNHSNHNNNIEITHYRSERCNTKGYTRRHVLFITDKLVEELQNNVLKCTECLTNIANKQELTEEYLINRKKLLFSTRLLEQTLLTHIENKSNTFCEGPKCVFENEVNTADSKPDYSKFDYVFFAIGTNAGEIRNEYFYNIGKKNKIVNVKITTPLAEPIVAFYSELGTPKEKINELEMVDDKNSKILIITKERLKSNGIDVYHLLDFVTIIYYFYDKIQIFLDGYIYRKIEREKLSDTNKAFIDNTDNNNLIFENLPQIIQNQINSSYPIILKLNVSLYGFDNYNSFLSKFANGIGILSRLFKVEQAGNNAKTKDVRKKFFDAYINFLKSEQMRPPIDDKLKAWHLKIINVDADIMDLVNNYIKFIYDTLHEVDELYKHDEPENRRKKICTIEGEGEVSGITLTLPDGYSEGHDCLNYNFLVNIVRQSLDSFGIFNEKLAYAAKNDATNYFMIGDMANAYPAGISVEIGINFVNYIIPIFYNFYINENKTILKCKDLNIIELLDELLDGRYSDLLKYDTNIKYSEGKYRNLESLIKGIKRYYEINLETKRAGVCYDDDIFLTYYNVVLLIQFIKNVDLIIKNKQILAISEVLLPDDYKLIDKEFVKEEKRYNGKLQILS